MQNVHTLDINDIAKETKTNLNIGLDDALVIANRNKYGKNEFQIKKQKKWFQIFFEQYKDILMILLLCSAIISLIVEIFPTNDYGWGESLKHIGAWENFILIISVTIINAILGTVQILKSQKSLNSLKSLSQPKSKVIRSGKNLIIDTSEIVVGDIILLEAGDLIPADARLIESASLKVNESSLTGESETILKNTNILKDDKLVIGDRLNCVYSGCLVAYGRAKAIVTSVGINTEIGKINKLLNETKEQKTPLQVNLDKLAKILMYVVLVICFVLLAVNLSKIAFLNEINSNTVLPLFSDSLNFSIALAVAVIPEALSSIVTIVLSISTNKMAKKNAIVKDLKSVEGLGSVSVVCSDKTGTLTQNKMTVTDFYVNQENLEESKLNVNNNYHLNLINYSVLSSDAKVDGKESIGDPTEIALVDFLIKQKIKQSDLEKKHQRISEIPFDSERMMMSCLIKSNKNNLMITKGAIDKLLDKVTHIDINNQVRKITSKDIEQIKNVNTSWSNQGKRVLCFCYKNINKSTINKSDECDFVFLGLIAMIDPPRPEVIEAVKECDISGIRVVMITGDHQNTAVAIAKQIGIYKQNDWSMSGRELSDINQEKLCETVVKYSVYARVSPEDKIKIVRAWQSQNMIVSMTGDGVNDAPALKQANIGVAMGITGTEVSKDAASIILTDDNFATIISAIKFGRSVYNNIKSAIRFLLTGNLATVFISIILTIISLAMNLIITPFTAIQLLFLNLLTDSWPAISLGLEKYRNNVIYEKPRLANEFFLNKQFVLKIFYEALIMTVIVLAAFALSFFFTNVPTDLSSNIINSIRFENASGIAFLTLSFCRFFHGFNCKDDKPSIFKKESYDNWFLFGSILLGISLICLIYYIEPIYNIFFKLDFDIVFSQNNVSDLNLAMNDRVFNNYGMWIALGFGLLMIPFVQAYKAIWYLHPSQIKLSVNNK